MDQVTIALWFYLVYLFISQLLPIFVGIIVLKNTMSYVKGFLWACLTNISLCMFGIALFLIFCFSAEIGWSIDTLPLAGIVIGSMALVINIPIILVTLLIYRQIKTPSLSKKAV